MAPSAVMVASRELSLARTLKILATAAAGDRGLAPAAASLVPSLETEIAWHSNGSSSANVAIFPLCLKSQGSSP